LFIGVFGVELLKKPLKNSQSRLKMDTRAPNEGQYLFGPFRLDPAQRLLTRDGEPVALTHRVFEMLLALVRSPGRVLTKDELLDAVWPGRFMEEGSLTQAIFTLRKVLSGGGDDGQYIVTAPGRGYCFSAPIQAVAGPAPTAAIRQALSSGPMAPGETAPDTRLSQQHWPAPRHLAALCALAVVAAGIAVALWRRDVAPAPGKPIVVVVADFQNLSSDPLFDKTFTTATKIDLQQSPYLTVLPEPVVADTLELMTRPKDDRLTPALAQEVCARNNGQVAINGTIAQVGAKYLLTLSATDCAGNQIITAEKAEETQRDALLPSLDRLVERVRRRLGEPDASIEKFNVPMLKQRTASFEALRAYSEAYYDFTHGKNPESIPLFQHAIELDPNFAAAYDGLSTVYSNLRETKLDAANITKAYALRGNAGELEKLHIEVRYNQSVTGDSYETIRILKAWTELYPNDATAWSSLSNAENWIGEYAPAIEDGKQALALNPGAEGPYVVLARAYLHSGRFGPAAAICARSIAKHLDGYDTHRLLLQIAFARQDRAGVQRQMQWASGKPAERVMLIEAGQIAFSEGQVRHGLDLFARAVELGKSFGLGNFVAAPNARLLYDLGMADLARESLDQVPAGYDSADYRFALMEFGDPAHADALLRADLAKSPSDTLLNDIYAPEDRAAQDLRNHQPAKAIEALKPANPIELRTFDIPYLRGQAYLAAGDGAQATSEFEKIVANRGVDAVSPLYPLAHLGLARALRLQGKLRESRAAYETLFAFWKDADNDLPVLQDARSEYTKLPAIRSVVSAKN
jgi:DNA-binding winged helix-turn-helix (wHTH) protein/tetratricopeptide (TPR) repeat protein